MWPADRVALEAEQQRLGEARPEGWRPAGSDRVGGCFVCFERGGRGPGSGGDRGWAAAACLDGGEFTGGAIEIGTAGGPYVPGLLALREGPLLEAAVGRLPEFPDVLLVNATGRDHPRRAGLALHLGAVLGLPTIGITHRPLLAGGPSPGPRRGDTAPVLIGTEIVGSRLRVRDGVLPLVVHPGWRVALPDAVDVILSLPESARTPEPLREARRLARSARAADGR